MYQNETIFYDTYGAVFSIYGAVQTPTEDGKFKKDYIVQFTNYPGVPILVDGLAEGFFVEIQGDSKDKPRRWSHRRTPLITTKLVRGCGRSSGAEEETLSSTPLGARS